MDVVSLLLFAFAVIRNDVLGEVVCTIKSYDVPRVPQRIKRHTLFGFAYPIINPPKIPNSGGFSLPWFPGKSTKFDEGCKDNDKDLFELTKNDNDNDNDKNDKGPVSCADLAKDYPKKCKPDHEWGKHCKVSCRTCGKSSISSKLCEEKNCGDTCGISPFGPKYCTKDKACIGMPWGGPNKEECGRNNSIDRPKFKLKFKPGRMWRRSAKLKRNQQSKDPVLECEERLTTRQIYPRHTRPWDFGWNIAWSPSVHPNPYVWRFPKDSIASISTGASFRFNKWEKVSYFSGVEALLVTVPSCGGSVTRPGTIETPGWPHNYPNMEDCEWVIKFSQTLRIKLEFKVFDLQHHDECRDDYLEIRNGPNLTFPTIKGKICGNSKPSPVISEGNELHLHFHSDESTTGRGFQIDVSIVGTISSELCKNKKCGDNCGDIFANIFGIFGPTYCTKDKSCIRLPFRPDKKACDGSNERSCKTHDSSVENPTCAPHCCYNSNEWPLTGLSFQECFDYCKKKEDCTRADWYTRGACFVYSSYASTTCCSNCVTRGPKWISCTASNYGR